MKKRVAVCAAALLVVLIGVYFLAPVRPALARWAAQGHLRQHYPEYPLAPVEENVSVGTQMQTVCGVPVEWVEWYGVSAPGEGCAATVRLNGWLPLLVEESSVYRAQGMADLEVLESWPQE